MFLSSTTKAGRGDILDKFNADFSPDLEPMKGGYGDDYYNQFVADMRCCKGRIAPHPAVRAANNSAPGSV